jgi:type II secretory pathway pseudopilin PulG
MVRNYAHKKGYTLMEAVVALALLALVWVAAVNVIIISRASVSRAKHKVQASYVIQQSIEKLRRLPFNSIVSDTSSVIVDSKGTPDNPFDDLTGTQVITVSVKDPNYLKYALVQVSWNELLFGKSKTVTECDSTYIASDSQAN